MRAGDIDDAREIHFKLLPWMRAAFVESNPMPVKAALAMMGRLQNVLRLPLVPIADDAQRSSALGARRGGSDLVSVSDADAGAAHRGAGVDAGRTSRFPATRATSIDALLDALEAGEVRAAERGAGRRRGASTRG